MKNALIRGLAGLITGILLIPILKNLNVPVPYSVFLLPAGITLVFGAGVVIAQWLGRWIPWFFQFSKFVATGFMNATVDFGILNILIAIFGVAAGTGYVLFKSGSFIIANINSFFWNRAWVFNSVKNSVSDTLGGSGAAKKYIQFLIVSIIGLVINVGAATLVVNVIGVQFSLDATVWANVGATGGSAAGLIWNFLGYKLIVFKA